MWRTAVLASVVGMGLAGPAAAYEYGLQFGANYGARGLAVVGYAFKGNAVVGNCSYYIVSGGGGGRGGGGHHTTTHYDQTCTWDLVGNLLSVVPGAPIAPVPISSNGGLVIYARNARGDTTGTDFTSGARGFVNSASAQYAWVTQSGYVFLPNQAPVDISLRLRSEGDFPLVVSKIEPSALLAKVSVKSSACEKAPVKPGKTCVIVVTYDPRGIPQGDNPYTAYDTLSLAIISNSGQVPGFSETVEVAVSPGG